MSEQSQQPIPLKPPHRRVDRNIDPTYGVIVPVEKPALPSDGRYDVAAFLAVRVAVESSDERALEGYL